MTFASLPVRTVIIYINFFPRVVICIATMHYAQGKKGAHVLEKNVSENDIFRLQDSPTAEIFNARLEEFGRKCPNTMLYLKAIAPDKWVLYAQVVMTVP